MNSRQPLTFTSLDGLAFAAQRGRLNTAPAFTTAAIGPLIEWTGLSAAGLLLPLSEPTSFLCSEDNAFLSALCDDRQQWICPTTHATGLYRIPPKWPTNDHEWIAFGLALQKAAMAAGFPRLIAAQFVGAIGEMVSNISEHSGASESGIVAFQGTAASFEFIVADHGIGMLKSLQASSEYHELNDHGTALRLALTDGISRFGADKDRGHGFRPIFVGLANLSGYLRFRSGDHALIINGQKIDMISAHSAQKAPIAGFSASAFFPSVGPRNSLLQK